ncbi:hypothetical protein SAMN04488542_11799 [Fontibacillus panacisegetis]|uniref:TcaA protein NTF2-like domain-containing protein n=1 Tax=Fontibacillus panacisegetis TaxID=670482 RepID=A0A1G7P3Q9_9BACL|nr:hypothetical protein [Fontibacillus panacisegetis]SDF80747.1 hypothetical protein SAMN04488542_11799 [Fontibacillus panacisegetis]
MKKILVLNLAFLILTACNSESVSYKINNTDQITNTDIPVETEIIFTERQLDNTMDEISKLIKYYEKNLIEAINKGTFSFVEPNLLPDSNLFVAQKKLVNNLFTRKITEEFQNSEIYRTYYIDINKFDVEVAENIKINYPDKEGILREYHWIYSVEKVGESYFLSDIKEWANFEQDIEQRMGAVKADGFYVDELLESYPKALEECLNTLDITEIKRISANETVLNKQKSIMTGLLNNGSEFSVKMTILDYGEVDYINVGQLTISYTNKANKQGKFRRKYSFEFDEIRDEVTYEGYAVIKNLKEINE